jgi:ABC-2 type transport system ATP-binding protein
MKTKLKAQDLRYRIPYGDVILENVNFQVESGQLYGVLGKNGAGKTTLVDLIMGCRDLENGELLILGEHPKSDKRTKADRVAYMSQDITLKSNITVHQFLKFHSSFYPRYDHEEEKRLCQRFSLDREMKIGALSTGQRKKVQIVAGFSVRPELLVVDEITAVLDPETRSLFFESLVEYKSTQDAAIILATNIVEDLEGRADKILFIADKQANEYLPEEIPKLFNLKKKVA